MCKGTGFINKIEKNKGLIESVNVNYFENINGDKEKKIYYNISYDGKIEKVLEEDVMRDF